MVGGIRVQDETNASSAELLRMKSTVHNVLRLSIVHRYRLSPQEADGSTDLCHRLSRRWLCCDLSKVSGWSRKGPLGAGVAVATRRAANAKSLFGIQTAHSDSNLI